MTTIERVARDLDVESLDRAAAELIAAFHALGATGQASCRLLDAWGQELRRRMPWTLTPSERVTYWCLVYGCRMPHRSALALLYKLRRH